MAMGTNANGNSGDVRTAETYTNDQYSQITVTSTALTGSQWIGPMVRAQNAGSGLYVGIYFWNNGNPDLMLFKRISGNWTQLGSTSTGPLTAGTTAHPDRGRRHPGAFGERGGPVSAYDTSLTSGSPGIMANGAATAGTWSGGSAGFQVSYSSTDPTGIVSYNMISANNGYGVQTLRVLQPTHPAAGVAHNFLFVLPVEAGLGTHYGDASPPSRRSTRRTSTT